MTREPVTELDERFGEPGARSTPWETGQRHLADAEISWLTTVRADGTPHVTPLLTVWLDDALHFCTGPTEQKAKNLAGNPACAVTTGTNALHGGVDVVMESTAVRLSDETRLRRVAAAYEAKYGSDWHFDVEDGAFVHGNDRALVYELVPTLAFGFGKDPYSQTRWRFTR